MRWSVVPNDFYYVLTVGAQYTGSVRVQITNNDHHQAYGLRLSEVYISVKRPVWSWLRAVREERLRIPALASGYVDPTLLLASLETKDISLEFNQSLDRGQEFGPGWQATVVFPMVGRLSQLDLPFNNDIVAR